MNSQKEEFDFPTEEIDLPSKGLVYPKENPLSSGKIVMKYMTAKSEDILTNQNYIKNGTVIDKLLKSLIVSKVNYDDIIVGDKNAIMVAARVLGYGKDYEVTYRNQKVTIDLSKIEPLELDESIITPGKNEFKYTLPNTGVEITYKLLTNHDDKKIQAEIDGLKKINKQDSYELSTRLKFMILAVNGNTDISFIRKFVDNHLLARDAKAFRDHVKKTQPDINLTFTFEGENGIEEGVSIPITTNFFWPDSGI